jgi:hypothetical protein
MTRETILLVGIMCSFLFLEISIGDSYKQAMYIPLGSNPVTQEQFLALAESNKHTPKPKVKHAQS